MINQILFAFTLLFSVPCWGQKLPDTVPDSLRAVATLLDSIYDSDQMYRRSLRQAVAKFGWDSDEIKSIQKAMQEQDSINSEKVALILETYGWLGPEQVGSKANTALFLVLQHSALPVQETYLPMMRDAVLEGKALATNLALLEDRVALERGRMQIYGSQIGIDEDTGESYVLPLEDPDHVDERREAVGLEPMKKYVADWGIRWNVKEYKKMLPALIHKQMHR